jgi:hypothetical protein
MGGERTSRASRFYYSYFLPHFFLWCSLPPPSSPPLITTTVFALVGFLLYHVPVMSLSLLTSPPKGRNKSNCASSAYAAHCFRVVRYIFSFSFFLSFFVGVCVCMCVFNSVQRVRHASVMKPPFSSFCLFSSYAPFCPSSGFFCWSFLHLFNGIAVVVFVRGRGRRCPCNATEP